VAGYACSTGYTIAGTTCTVAATQAASSAYTCPGGGILTGTDCVTSTAPSSSSGLTCQTPTQVCSDSSPTSRLVDGVAVSHDCWGWTDNYQCAKLTPANNCASLQSQANCSFDHETCLDDGCYTKSEVYLCKTGTTTATAQAVTCTGDIYCIDGSCNQVTREASPDFENALVAINAMGDADGQFDPNSDHLRWRGDGCHKPLFGLVNCCAGKVSGLLFSVGAALLLTGGSALIGLATQFLTLFLCSSEEIQLDVKDRMGVCHYVGEYCSESCSLPAPRCGTNIAASRPSWPA
jgi:conjugal transfer mating pair stabilization protein TraN